mgnify:CR=1 FL=1
MNKIAQKTTYYSVKTNHNLVEETVDITRKM